MAQFQIDPEKRRFVVTPANYDEGSVIMKLPARRWMQTRRVFIVPWVPLNMKLLHEAHTSGKLLLDADTLKVVSEAVRDKKSNRKFPSWYSFKRTPFQVQREAIDKVYSMDTFALFMKMGRGKSKTAIDLMTAHFYERRIQLVVAVMPLSVTTVWGGERGELAEHSPIATEVVYATSKFDVSRLRLRQDRITWVMVGIEGLSAGRLHEKLAPLFANFKVGLLVDEASRIANHATLRTERITELGRSAPIRGILTGTPAKRKLTDLFSLYHFLDPNIIGCGDFYSFRNRYCVMGGYKNKQVIGYDNVDELMRLCEPYTYTCGKDPSLPKQIWLPPRRITLTDEQKDVYQKIRKNVMEGLTVKNVLSRVMRLQQVVGGFYSLDPEEKVSPLTGKVRKIKGEEVHFLPYNKNPKIIDLHDVLEEHDGSPVIIWAAFLKEIEDLVQAMCERTDASKVARVQGGMTKEERLQLRDDFQDGKYEYLVGNAVSGGLGLTLTRSHFMVYYSNTQSGEDRLQSEDRIHRQGQEEPCLYLDMLAKGTVDLPIYASMLEKKDLDVYVREKILAAGGKVTDRSMLEYLEQMMGEI